MHKSVVVVGAGFSKIAGGPLLRELLNVERSAADDKALAALRELSRNHAMDVERAFSVVWIASNTGKDLHVAGKQWDASVLLEQLRIHLSSLCEEVHLRRGTLMRNSAIDFVRALNKEKTQTYISFNYDLFLESLLVDGDVIFDYGPPWVIDFTNRAKLLTKYEKEAEVLKLHGSSNWGICATCRANRGRLLINVFDRPYVATRRRRCGGCKETLLASGIVPPMEGKAGQLGGYSSLWKRARNRLRNASRVLVIGYSLPRTDLEAVDLFSELDAETPIELITGPTAPPAWIDLFPNAKHSQLYFENLLQGEYW